ncbi:hypothetical protein EET67_19540 [Pseudaminobacter arsenicus]|uniref:Uncharacterized protein n=1 Tax=Borborobacter arsenicus TaxID=1851146 RepID=A0A432V1V4_9HYPH|nr:hypothetical protein [Pseudaminobacter arsenicus]RUM96184.1 hypothetical protein EET67_19540 [Pseudaminobacter arsenicus]
MMNNLVWSGAVVALLAAVSSAHSENLQWFSNQYDETTVLAYGMPDTDYAPIVFNCDMGDESARVFVTHDAPDAEDGQQMNIRLSSDAGSVELTAIGQFQEIDDLFHLEAQARLDQKLVRILSAGDILQVSIEGETQEIPLAGADDKVGVLVAACEAPLNPNDIEFRITNRTETPVVSFLFSERGVNDFDGDTYGNQVLLPGESTYLVIPDGKPACTFDLRAEFDEDAERDPFDGFQNLCEDSEFLVTGE